MTKKSHKNLNINAFCAILATKIIGGELYSNYYEAL